MPQISFDGQSFLVGGRRVWLVSGAIHYPRVPRQLWRDRIRAAREAGLNCIETYVFWNVHETAPGEFDFEGDTDLGRFVEIVAEEGMFCILRPGPYVCAEWDNGGLPAWLSATDAIRLREGDGPFLEACARYLGAVMRQVADLQITSPLPTGKKARRYLLPCGEPVAGPIILVQAENEYFCDNPEQADTYLRELVRYLRENGCTVPINECNNLWAGVEGTIATWNANRHLAADLRQLRQVQPHAPRLVTEYWPGWYDQWNAPHENKIDAALHEQRIASMLAVGTQFSCYMFHGGTNFAFFGGRTVANDATYITTSYDYDAPLREAGGRGAKYLASKRICTFASQFGHVFAHLDPDFQTAAAPVDEDPAAPSIVHQRGAQGEVVFCFKGAKNTADETEVMLPNGLTLTVPFGAGRVAWLLLNTNLGGTATLSYTNLRPWAFCHDQLLVLFGPSGAEGVVALNDAAFDVTVPKGKQPLVEPHEEITVVVCNEKQIDTAIITDTGVLVDGHLIAPDGAMETIKAKPAPRTAVPKLAGWQRADVRDLVTGESDQFKAIEGPQSLEALGCNFGYGWYRLCGIEPPSTAGKLMLPGAADRLHLFCDGHRAATLGRGPGTADPQFGPFDLKPRGDLVALADNLGRFNFGWNVGEPKGIWDHLYTVKPLALGKVKAAEADAPDLFSLRAFWLYVRYHERPAATTLTWNFKPSGKNPVIVDISALPWRAGVLVNGELVDAYDPISSAGHQRLVLRVGDQIKAGANRLTLAFFQKLTAAQTRQSFAKFLRLYQVTANLSATAQWAFAPWTTPAAKAFADLDGASTVSGEPCWYRCQFDVKNTATPLWLEPRGLTKGQIYINGHNAGRYFVATPTGKAVPPQKRYYLPEPWLHTDEPNELLIFEEHGKSPAKCKLAYDAMGPYGGGK